MDKDEKVLKRPVVRSMVFILCAAIVSFVYMSLGVKEEVLNLYSKLSEDKMSSISSAEEIANYEEEELSAETEFVENLYMTSKYDEVFADESNIAPVHPTEIAEQEDSSAIEILECSDCMYAPVDKYHSLTESFVPVLEDTNLTGGGKLRPDVLTALKEFFESAKKDGISLSVLSAYRSYETQTFTFNFWVNREISYGRSQDEAEIRANTYSARPGHSEHQLGTTVDLKNAKCGSYDQKCNKPAYEYIGKNAHKYGFVISYPDGLQNSTGYKYEPWHIRFIGKDLAQELYDTDYLQRSGEYLTKFLLEKELGDY